MMLTNGGAIRPATCSTGTELANALMFLTRGQPVVYYGDEQGFIGGGGDKDARQDMFATQVAELRRRRRSAPARTTGSDDRYDTDAAAVPADRGAVGAARGQPGARRRRADPPLRLATAPASSRSAGSTRATSVEYLVVANNATTAKTATFATYSAERHVHARSTAPATDAASGDGRPGRRSPCRRCRCRCGRPAPTWPKRQSRAGGLPHARRGAGGVVGGRAEIGAAVPDERVRPGDLRLPPGGHDGLDRRSAPTTTRRTACSTTSPALAKGTLRRVPRGRSRTAAGNLLGDLVVRRRRRPRARRWRRRAGRPGHPARQRERARARTTARWAAPATGSRTARRRS